MDRKMNIPKHMKMVSRMEMSCSCQFTARSEYYSLETSHTIEAQIVTSSHPSRAMVDRYAILAATKKNAITTMATEVTKSCGPLPSPGALLSTIMVAARSLARDKWRTIALSECEMWCIHMLRVLRRAIGAGSRERSLTFPLQQCHCHDLGVRTQQPIECFHSAIWRARPGRTSL